MSTPRLPNAARQGAFALVTVREAGGRIVGPVAVHGAGGPLRPSDRLRFERAIHRATQGHPLVGFYEPKPGHVRAYVVTMQRDVDVEPLNLANAVLESWV